MKNMNRHPQHQAGRLWSGMVALLALSGAVTTTRAADVRVGVTISGEVVPGGVWACRDW